MALHLNIIGILLLLLAAVHVLLPNYLQWKRELAVLSLINKQVMEVHTFFIAFAVLLMGALCLYAADEIVNTPLGHTLAFGLFIFWFARLLAQFLIYKPVLWKGKRFETAVHIIFAALWTYMSAVFLLVSIGYKTKP